MNDCGNQKRYCVFCKGTISIGDECSLLDVPNLELILHNGCKEYFLGNSRSVPLLSLEVVRSEIYGGATAYRCRLNGLTHRVHGPAIFLDNGVYCYCLYNITHREDGPAVRRLYTLSSEQVSEGYYLHGSLYSKDNFYSLTNEERKLTRPKPPPSSEHLNHEDPVPSDDVI